MICKYQRRQSIPALARIACNMRVRGVGRFFNSMIEKMFYETPLRARVGLFGIARAHTVPAWLANLVYSRVRPKRLLGTVLFCSALMTIRAAVWAASRLSRFFAKHPETRATQLTREECRAVHCTHQCKGDAILFIHDMPTNHRLWDGVIGQLSGRHRCFAVDLPGMGETPFAPYKLDYLDRMACK
jgi:hypothetical protein